MSTNEISLIFDYLLHHTEEKFKSVQLDILETRSEIWTTFGTTEQITKKAVFERTKRGDDLIALGLLAVTAGAGVACSLGKFLGACRGTSEDCEVINGFIAD